MFVLRLRASAHKRVGDALLRLSARPSTRGASALVFWRSTFGAFCRRLTRIMHRQMACGEKLLYRDKPSSYSLVEEKLLVMAVSIC